MSCFFFLRVGFAASLHFIVALIATEWNKDFSWQETKSLSVKMMRTLETSEESFEVFWWDSQNGKLRYVKHVVNWFYIVCVKERERVRVFLSMCLYVLVSQRMWRWVCVWVFVCVCVFVCVLVCVCVSRWVWACVWVCVIVSVCDFCIALMGQALVLES